MTRSDGLEVMFWTHVDIGDVEGGYDVWLGRVYRALPAK